jgi:hypothetical protein
VFKALSELSQGDQFLSNAADVDRALKRCAVETMGPLVRHRIVTEANSALLQALAVGGDPTAAQVAPSVAASVRGSADRVTGLLSTGLSASALREQEQAIRDELAGHLESDEWRSTFRGRDILAQFAQRHAGVNYEAFRDSVLARMKDAGHRLAGMARILNAILSDPFPGPT